MCSQAAKGVSEGEVTQMFEDVKAKRSAIVRAADAVDAQVTDTEASLKAGARRTTHRFAV
jgi:hypothetical protein